MISIWEKDILYAPVDILIAGSGLMGLWTAYEIKKRRPGLSVQIIDRGNIPTGASTRNAGFACFGSATELISDKANTGNDLMLEVVNNRYKGIQKTRAVLGDAAIGFEPCGGYEAIQANYKEYAFLQEHIDTLNKDLQSITGLPQTFTIDNGALQTQGLTGFDALVYSSLEGALHSGKLVNSLTALVQQMGVTIRMHTELLHWEQLATQINVQTPGAIIPCQQLIIATNGFTQNLLPELHIKPGRGQVVVTKPIPGLRLHGTFHFDEGFYYWRHLGNRVLLGGGRNMAFEEEETCELQTTGTIQNVLHRFLQQHILQPYGIGNTEDVIDYSWAGIMAFTENKLPQVTTVAPNIHAVIACNGMGVALSSVIAEQVADTVFR
ncbi:NAD(P)/FAD-dependent oxidoreductase [Terrimonas rubra]|uniref:NAD(P)/FAD-dependent oxidoreductase n=1 Tax=Terrimonas rubra TaxID=1035890 RepID=A0ABW6A2D8_9BACT